MHSAATRATEAVATPAADAAPVTPHPLTRPLHDLSTRLGAPCALLQRVRGRWRFVAATDQIDPNAIAPDERGVRLDDPHFTGVALEGADDWLLLICGPKKTWEERTDLADEFVRLTAMARTLVRAQRSTSITRADRIGSVLARRLSRSTEPRRVYDDIVRAMTYAVSAEVGALAVYAPEEGALQIVSSFGYPRAIVDHLRIKAGEGILGRVFASGESLLVSGPDRPSWLPSRPRYRTESCIVVPLRHGDRINGVISVADPTDGQHFVKDDLAAIRRIVPVAALALERFSAYAELHAVARTAQIDPVTGLANRQYLQRRLHAEIERAQRLHQPLAMVLLDVDDFKRVNDTWGHVEGDQLLREIAQLLAENVRIFDVCTRYGGEEFAVVMPGATESIVRHVAERVRRSVEDAFKGAIGGPKITLSAGGTLLQPGDSAEQLFRRADAALLTAKRQGKNVVKFSSPEN